MTQKIKVNKPNQEDRQYILNKNYIKNTNETKMRLEIFGIEIVIRSIRGNNDQMVSIPLKDYKNMQNEIRTMRIHHD